jgi:hypothetical protein
MKLRLAVSLVAFPAAFAQGLPSFILAMSPNQNVVQVQVPPNPPRAVTGAAFSAVEVQEIERLLPDGSRRAETQPPHRLFRDALGRTRVERGRVVEINDPGAGVYYLLDTQSQTAYVVKYRPARAVQQQSTRPLPTVTTTLITPGGPAGSGPVPVTAPLGERTIHGVDAEGQRSTVGNRITETWYSPELQMTLLTTVTDPAAGNSKVEITELSREEPASALFQPPPDSRLVDQPAFFTAELK